VINIVTSTDNVLDLNVNLGKYIVYMHYSVYCKLLAARIFATLEAPLLEGMLIRLITISEKVLQI